MLPSKYRAQLAMFFSVFIFSVECSSQLQFVLSSLYPNAHGFEYCAPIGSVSLGRRDTAFQFTLKIQNLKLKL